MALGALGKRETEDGSATCALEPDERSTVRAQALGVLLKSLVVAVVATAAAALLTAGARMFGLL